jgi:hypothetical protein
MRCDQCHGFATKQHEAFMVQRAQEFQAQSSFDDEWTTAPRSMRNYVEAAVAEFWFERGRLAERGRMLSEQNADMREMLRVGNERIRQ